MSKIRRWNWYYVQINRADNYHLGFYKDGEWTLLSKPDKKYLDSDFCHIDEDTPVPEEPAVVNVYRRDIEDLKKQVKELNDKLEKEQSFRCAKLAKMNPNFNVRVDMLGQKGKRNFEDNVYYVGAILEDNTLPKNVVVIDEYCTLRHNTSQQIILNYE